MLLTGLSVALFQDNGSMFIQAGIRNADKKDFQTVFVNIYRNLHFDLGAIL